MPLLVNTNQDRRYSLIFRGRQPSVSEIDTTAIKADEKRNQSPTPTSTPKKTKKSVSFFEIVEIYDTIHLDDYTNDEISQCWYNQHELKLIKSRLVPTVRLIADGHLSQDTQEHCIRGLEIRTKKGSQQRFANKMRGWDAVLDEQAIQRNRSPDDSIEDHNAIALAYIHATAIIGRNALIMGLRDQAAVATLDSSTEQSEERTTRRCDNKKTTRRNALRDFLKRAASKKRQELMEEIKDSSSYNA